MAQQTLIKGQELFIYMGADAIAFSTSCSLEINYETIDASNKDAGGWAKAIKGQNSWTCSTDALVSSKENVAKLTDAAATGTPVAIKFGTSASAAWYSGNAFITSVSITAGNNEIANMSISFTGDGELAKVVAGA